MRETSAGVRGNLRSSLYSQILIEPYYSNKLNFLYEASEDIKWWQLKGFSTLEERRSKSQ